MGRAAHTPLKGREFRITSKCNAQTNSQGNPYLECDTTVGIVAFWGRVDNLANIDAIKGQQLPVSVTAGCIDSNWEQHDLWAPEYAEVAVHG